MSATTDPSPTAVLTIGVGVLTEDLRKQLADLGAQIVDVAALDEPLVLTFAPIEGVGDPVSSMTIVEPTAAQIELWDGLTGTKAQIKAISVCATVPVGVVEKLPARVFMQAVKRVEAFLA